MHPTPPQRRTVLRPKRVWRRPIEDRVSPEQAAAVFARDKSCMAPRLGGSINDCFGKDRIEHVKVEPMMGKRGNLLLVLCEGHTEPGMKRGYIWCTDAKNRQACREYVLSFET